MKQGFGLIEIVIVTAIVSGALFAFSQAGAFALKLLRHEKETLEMTLLAQEGLEAARSVRDRAWNDIASRTDAGSPSSLYYPILSAGKWVLTATSPGLISSKYTRSLIFEKVMRNGSDTIVAAGGTDDTGTRKVISRVAAGTRTVELAAYLTDFQQYLSRPADAISIAYEGAATDINVASFPSDNAGDGDPAQSFTTPSSSIKVTKISLFLRRTTTAPSSVFVEIRTGPTAVAIATSTTIQSSTVSGTTAEWVDFAFPDPVQLSASTLYYLRVRSIPDSTVASSGSAGNLNWLYTRSGSSGPYAGGAGRRYIGRLSTPSDPGQSLDDYDFGFRVYALQ